MDALLARMNLSSEDREAIVAQQKRELAALAAQKETELKELVAQKETELKDLVAQKDDAITELQRKNQRLECEHIARAFASRMRVPSYCRQSSHSLISLL